MQATRTENTLVLADPELDTAAARMMISAVALAPAVLTGVFIGIEEVLSIGSAILNGVWVCLWLYAGSRIARYRIELDGARDTATLTRTSLSGRRTTAIWHFSDIDRFEIVSEFASLNFVYSDDNPVMVLRSGRRITISGCSHARFSAPLAEAMAEANAFMLAEATPG
jgi:hypothetical protein